MLKAVETRYKGYRMRSRLEARYAVFLDHLGVAWEYEAQGYELPGIGRYLPDFWLPKRKDWIEIKPVTPTPDEIMKASILADMAEGESDVYILCGTPGEEKIWAALYRGNFLTPEQTESALFWCEFFDLCPTPCSPYCLKTRAAYNAARAARFEYGEKGNVA